MLPELTVARHPRTRCRARAALLAGLLVLGACEEDPTDEVTSGTINGVAFSVVSGTVLQPVADGPIYAPAPGALVTLDEDPAGLGMSNPDHLHLRTRFAISNGGSLSIAGFGTTADPIGTGATLTLTRDLLEFDYVVRLNGAMVADDRFAPRPAEAGVEHWIVTEFYADDVPGYGSGNSGATFWPIDDESPAFATDVLGCAPGPALEAATLAGSRIAYELSEAFVTAISVVDTIIGPCE
jgi:hypothetical protein